MKERSNGNGWRRGIFSEDATKQKRKKRLTAAVEILLFATLMCSIRFWLPFVAFRPTREIVLTPAAYGMPFEDVTIAASDGTAINGWFVKSPDERGILLFFHGNAGNISGRLDSIEIFRSLGMSVFIIDYRGYGRSAGARSVSGVTLDALAAWNYLTETRGVSPEKIAVFGRSLGGAVAMELMRCVTPRALILESTFSSLPEMIRVSFLAPVARFIIGDVWNSAEAAAALTIPTLCLHSPNDEIAPYRLGKRLFDSVASEKTFVELHGYHNSGFLESMDIYKPALDKFFTDNFGERK